MTTTSARPTSSSDRRRAAVHQLLPPGRLHRPPGARLRTRTAPAAKDAIAQILTNSRMCAEGHRPICQDTGIVNVFLKIGMDVRWEGFAGSDRGRRQRRRAPGLPEPRQRAARQRAVRPHLRAQEHQGQHAGVVHMELVPGNKLDVTVAAKGGGSENKSKVVHAQPQRRHRRLGAQDRAHHGRRLVPAGHAGHRRGRHGREGHAAGQGGADGRHRHVRTAGARPARTSWKNCASSCTRRSTRWASARRAWAA
jgi:hypothetical protein